MNSSEILKMLLAEARVLVQRMENGFDFSDEDLCTDVIVHVERPVVELRQAAVYIPAPKLKNTEYPFEVHLVGWGATIPWAAFLDRDEAQKAAVAKAERDGGKVYGYPKGQRFSTNVLDKCVTFCINDDPQEGS